MLLPLFSDGKQGEGLNRPLFYSISAHSASSPNSSACDVTTSGGLYVVIIGVRSVVNDVRAGDVVVVASAGAEVVTVVVIRGAFSASCSLSSTF